MTLHAAKGLEFPVVFLVGMENGVFPSQQSQFDPTLLEEERRLAYVGITRAKKKLYILNAYSRMQFGKTTANPPSMFISEIPEELTENTSVPRGSQDFGGYGSFGGYQQRGNGRYFTDSADRGYAPSRSGQSYSDFGSTAPETPRYPARRPERTIPKYTAGESSKKTPPADIKIGVTVMHKKFGKGLVVFAQPLANDILLEVAFESCGTKKLMAGAAHLEVVND